MSESLGRSLVWRLVEGYYEKEARYLCSSEGCIRFHEEGGSSNSQSDFSTLGDDLVFGGVSITTDLSDGDLQGSPLAPTTFFDVAPLHAVPEPTPVSSPLAVATTAASLDEREDDVVPEDAVVGTDGLNDVFVVDDSGRVHVAESVLLGDEHDIFVSGVPHAVAGPVTVSPTFDAFEE
ncbi:hypothetical protein V6N13_099180 [Hibiscus sabdariffa]|uniref:Uncharacterized protein n=1 Tax=Hibiscus sabdariffa TaxID=183260 RepID=A0ABR2PYV8_9ROSI